MSFTYGLSALLSTLLLTIQGFYRMLAMVYKPYMVYNQNSALVLNREKTQHSLLLFFGITGRTEKIPVVLTPTIKFPPKETSLLTKA